MDSITHKIKFKSGENEIEIVGTKDFAEQWFVKLHSLLPAEAREAAGVEAGIGKTAMLGIGAAPGIGRRALAKLSGDSIQNNIMSVAYNLQEQKGKAFMLIKDIRSELIQAGKQVPKEARDLSVAISANIKKGFLHRLDKSVGRQKAFRLTDKGKKYAENGCE